MKLTGHEREAYNSWTLNWVYASVTEQRVQAAGRTQIYKNWSHQRQSTAYLFTKFTLHTCSPNSHSTPNSTPTVHLLITFTLHAWSLNSLRCNPQNPRERKEKTFYCWTFRSLVAVQWFKESLTPRHSQGHELKIAQEFSLKIVFYTHMHTDIHRPSQQLLKHYRIKRQELILTIPAYNVVSPCF